MRGSPTSSRWTATTLSLLFVVVALLTRLPHLLGGHVALDGDEAIVGLMARDLMDGVGVPVFFYGQRYGLSLLEVAPLAAAFRWLGDAPIVIKCTMLALWLVGGVFAVHTARRAAGATAALVAGLVLATLPAWIGWSMKARGGYVTAFVVAQLALWILAGVRERRHRDSAADAAPGPACGLGASLSLVFFAQPFFLLPLLPSLYFVTPRRAAGSVAFGALAVGIPLAILGRGSTVVWDPHLFGPPSIDAVIALPARVATALSGVFYYTEVGRPPELVAGVGLLFAALLAILVLYGLASRVRDEQTALLRATAAGILLSLFAVLWIRPEAFAYRYLLPAAAPIAVLAGAVAARFETRGLLHVRVATALLCALGAAVAWADRDVSFARVPGEDAVVEAAATDALLDHLHARGIGDVYVLDPMYQWNVIFESDRRIRARWIHPFDRIPAISRAVDAALREGRPVALIGDARLATPLREGLDRSGLARIPIQVVAERHLVLENPPKALLRALGFAFTDEPEGATPAP